MQIEHLHHFKPKFQVGEKVRISKYKRLTFDKSCTSNWTEQNFLLMAFKQQVTLRMKLYISMVKYKRLFR